MLTPSMQYLVILLPAVHGMMESLKRRASDGSQIAELPVKVSVKDKFISLSVLHVIVNAVHIIIVYDNSILKDICMFEPKNTVPHHDRTLHPQQRYSYHNNNHLGKDWKEKIWNNSPVR